jgi:GPH family glycoside/pentoside/hexuronide:cation symporter
MHADVVEDSERATGRRSEGLFLAGPALLQKSVSGAGYLCKGALLALSGFSAAEGEVEKVAATQRLALAVVALSAVLPPLALYILSHYAISRRRHLANLAKLGYAHPLLPAGDGSIASRESQHNFE